MLGDGRVVLDSPENREALAALRRLITSGVSPELVTTASEEPARRIFGQGRALFLRNWPYAWTLFQQADSPVAGKVGIAPLPHFQGHESAAALGGWQLAVNARSRQPEAAQRLVAFLTSADAQEALVLAYGLYPTRRALYRDPDMLAAQPQLPALEQVFEGARPRPVTPRYVAISQVMQGAFSAAVTSIETPDTALGKAQERIEGILAGGR